VYARFSGTLEEKVGEYRFKYIKGRIHEKGGQAKPEMKEEHGKIHNKDKIAPVIPRMC